MRLFFTLAITTFAVMTLAQNSDLYKTIYQNDQRLFHAFNECDIETNMSFLSEDIEFYHDKSGLMTYDRLENATKERCANENIKLRRKLVKNSMEVYPLNGGYAIQEGTHRFFLSENGNDEHLIEIAKFVHLWKYENGQWRITRVLSYDHQGPE